MELSTRSVSDEGVAARGVVEKNDDQESGSERERGREREGGGEKKRMSPWYSAAYCGFSGR